MQKQGAEITDAVVTDDALNQKHETMMPFRPACPEGEKQMEAGEIAPLCVMGGASDQVRSGQSPPDRQPQIDCYSDSLLESEFVNSIQIGIASGDSFDVLYSNIYIRVNTRTWTGLLDIFRWIPSKVLSNHQIPD